MDPSGAPGGPPWERYRNAVLRHKWIILLVTVCGTGGGVFATRFVQMKYSTETTLWMEIDNQTGPERGPIRDGQLLESTAWLELLTSATVLEPVVRERRLYVSTATPEDLPFLSTLDVRETFRTGTFTLQMNDGGDEFALVDGEGAVIERGRRGDAAGRAVGLLWVPPAEAFTPGRSIEFSVRNPHDVARSLGSQLQPSIADQSSFLTISLEGTDPKRTAETLNAVADRYVRVAAELKRAKLVELTSILGQQLRSAENSLHQAEMAFENFQVQTVTLPSEQASPVAAGLAITRDPVFSNYFDLKVRRERLREDREAIERVLREAQGSSVALDALAGIPAVADGSPLAAALQLRTTKRAELRAMEQRYTEQYAPRRQLAAELGDLDTKTIPQLARDVVAALASEESLAEERIGSASGELRQIPPRAIEEARLERQVAIAEELHTTLKQRYEVARLAAEGSVPDIRVLDPAVEPSAPTGDPRRLLVVAGLLGSFGLAVAGVILLDRMDPRVRYPEQLSQELGLPVIGIVPHLQAGKGRRGPANAAVVAEAFREIRLSLLHSYGSAGPVLFTITSAEAGDGKSFIAANLALAFAQQGRRTLVIDGDIHRGRLHHQLGGERTPGLTDYLSGRASQGQILQTTPYANVTLIGSGTRMELGPELLGSSAMANLTRGMRSLYDVIIIDSPPLGAGVDPFVLGTVAGNMLLVFRTGNTSRAFAEAKLALVDRLPIRLLGAILNDVPAGQKMYRYYSYLPGYQTENEAGANWVLKVVSQGAAPSAPEEEEEASAPQEPTGGRFGLLR